MECLEIEDISFDTFSSLYCYIITHHTSKFCFLYCIKRLTLFMYLALKHMAWMDITIRHIPFVKHRMEKNTGLTGTPH